MQVTVQDPRMVVDAGRHPLGASAARRGPRRGATRAVDLRAGPRTCAARGSPCSPAPSGPTGSSAVTIGVVQFAQEPSERTSECAALLIGELRVRELLAADRPGRRRTASGSRATARRSTRHRGRERDLRGDLAQRRQLALEARDRDPRRGKRKAQRSSTSQTVLSQPSPSSCSVSGSKHCAAMSRRARRFVDQVFRAPFGHVGSECAARRSRVRRSRPPGPARTRRRGHRPASSSSSAWSGSRGSTRS